MIANHLLETVASTPKQRKGLTLFEFVVATGVVLLIGFVAVAFLLPVTRSARPTAYRSQCKNNLKQIAIALHNYHDQYHAFPPAYTIDADGKPLHSWRTLILPYMEQKALYYKIDLTKPWDDPVNAEAYKSGIEAYRCPATKGPANHTSYMAIVTSDSCFRSTEPRMLSEITDETAKTLLVIEVDSESAVHWMAPIDADEAFIIRMCLKTNLTHTGGMHVAFVDGSVTFLNQTVSPGTLHALISIAGKEPLIGY